MVDNKIAWDTKYGVVGDSSRLVLKFPLDKCYSDGQFDWLHTGHYLNCNSVRRHTAAQLVRAEWFTCFECTHIHSLFSCLQNIQESSAVTTKQMEEV
jgi:hypothetical protein